MDKHNTSSQHKARLVKLSIGGTFLIIIAIAVNVIDPLGIIVKNLEIREGSLLFYLFKKPPIDVYFNCYIFNVTNSNAFMNGSDKKLKFEEIGPYVYREVLEHINYTFHPNDTLSYVPIRKCEFIRERSIGDPNVDVITIPNIVLLAAASVAADLSIFAAMAFNTFTNSLGTHPILNVTVHDYLWGYNDPLLKIASTIIPSINFDKLGILDRVLAEGENLILMNLPKTKWFESKQNSNNIMDDDSSTSNASNIETINKRYGEDYDIYINDTFLYKGEYYHGKNRTIAANNSTLLRDYSIISINGQSGLNQWGYDAEDKSKNTPCNTLSGAYDGTIFPKNMSKNETFSYYRKAFCRLLPITYNHTQKIDGVDANVFTLVDKVFSSDFDDSNYSCYCKNKKCMRQNLGDVTPCYYNMPVAVSHPHFYKSDTSLLEGVDGMKPNASIHESYVVIQPQCGVPMRVSAKVQLNLVVGSTRLSNKIRKFQDTTLPLLWVELSVDELRLSMRLLLQTLFIILPYAQFGCICLFWIIGISIIAIAVLGCVCVPHPDKAYNPKKDIRYSAIYMLPYIKREIEKCMEEGPGNCETV